MSRWWTESVAALGDILPLPLAALLLVLVAAVAAALWYWFPVWVPRRLPRLRRPRLHRPAWRLRWPRLRWPRLHWRWLNWRWLRQLLLNRRWPWRRRRTTAPEVELGSPAGEDLPELPAATLASLADRLAAEGRYAEAVRERLRAIVRELVDRRVIEHRPGWTVTELAGQAGRARPAVDAPLRAAGTVFSDLWYGERPAGATHDARMRELAGEVRAALAGREAGPP